MNAQKLLFTIASQCHVPEGYCEYISMRRGNEALNTLHCHGDTFAHKARHFLAVCRGSFIMDTGIIMLAICLCATAFQGSPQ